MWGANAISRDEAAGGAAHGTERPPYPRRKPEQATPEGWGQDMRVRLADYAATAGPCGSSHTGPETADRRSDDRQADKSIRIDRDRTPPPFPA